MKCLAEVSVEGLRDIKSDDVFSKLEAKSGVVDI